MVTTKETVAHVPDYEASKRQSLFHLSVAFETLYGGAAGGGKSGALCAEAVTLCLENPGIRVYIFRKTIPELKQSILPEIRKQCADYMLVPSNKEGYRYKMEYHGTDREFRFDNGSIIRLSYCQNPGDEYQYQSAEIHALLIDELTHFHYETYEFLKTRVRSADATMPLKVMCATNPGNIGHGWVKNRFIDGNEPEKMVTDPINKQTRIFIPAKVDDHPIKSFRVAYKKRLQAIDDPKLRRALLEGDWDVFAGQVFTEWRRDKHVIEPFQVPEHWPRWMGYDWGYGSPAAAVWLTKNPFNGRMYVYREYYDTGQTVRNQAASIKHLDGGELVQPRLADPSIWKSRTDVEAGETIAEVFMREQVPFTPANNERLGGKAAVHDALSVMADGKPKLQVFSNCLNLIRTLPSLPYDENKVEDVDTDAEDHLYDALRYALINQRKKAPKKLKPDKLFNKEGWY